MHGPRQLISCPNLFHPHRLASSCAEEIHLKVIEGNLYELPRGTRTGNLSLRFVPRSARCILICPGRQRPGLFSGTPKRFFLRCAMILARVRLNRLLRTGEPYEPRPQDRILTGDFFACLGRSGVRGSDRGASLQHCAHGCNDQKLKMTDHRMRSSASLQPELDPSRAALSGLAADASLAQAARIHYEIRQDLGPGPSERAAQIG
jgi:hypothetical protein